MLSLVGKSRLLVGSVFCAAAALKVVVLAVEKAGDECVDDVAGDFFEHESR